MADPERVRLALQLLEVRGDLLNDATWAAWTVVLAAGPGSTATANSEAGATTGAVAPLGTGVRGQRRSACRG